MLPRRIAAVDMGTNSFHLIIVESSDDKSFKLLDKEREVIRLASHEGENLSRISEGEMEKAIDILQNFKALADFYKAEFFAVATSAVRESSNKDEFLRRLYKKTKIVVDVIDGKKEAELIFLGIRKAIPVSDKKALCIDIGGGSTELIYKEKLNPVFSESLKIGAVRLTKKFFPDYKIDKTSINKCEKYIEQILSSNKNLRFNIKPEIVIGTSGTIIAAAAMIHQIKHNKKLKKPNKVTFTSEEFSEIAELVLSSANTSDRLKIPGIEIKRADIIPAGILILKSVMNKFNIHQITISEFALREGIICKILSQN